VTGTDGDLAPPRAPEPPKPDATNGTWIGAGIVLVVAAAVVLHAGRGVTFLIDEWQWIQSRTSPSTTSLLEPFHDHWMTVPIAIHQGLYRTFGIASHLPYRAVLLAAHLAAAFLLFCYLRTRLRPWIALAAMTLFALYGYTAAIIVWPISLGWAIAVACAIGALLLVDHRRSSSDLGAAALLLVAVASTTIAVPFAIGLAVEMTMRRAWRRLWVPLAPLTIYGVWFLAYSGAGSEGSGTARQAVRFAQELLAQTVGTLLGIQDRGAAADTTLVIVIGALLVAWFALGRPITPRLVGNATALAVLTVALAVGRSGSGLTTWFSYAVAASLLLTVGELFAQAHAPRRTGTTRAVTIAVWVVVIWAVVWNFGELERITDGFRRISAVERSQLAALALIQDDVPAGFEPGPLLQTVTAGRFTDVAREYGSPAYTVAETHASSPSVRAAADETLVRGLDVKPHASAPTGVERPAGRVTVRSGDTADDTPGDTCMVVRAGDTGDAVVDVRGPDLAVLVDAQSGTASLRAGVFAPASQAIGTVAPGDTVVVTAPPVPGAGDWTLRVRSRGALRLCAPPG